MPTPHAIPAAPRLEGRHSGDLDLFASKHAVSRGRHRHSVHDFAPALPVLASELHLDCSTAGCGAALYEVLLADSTHRVLCPRCGPQPYADRALVTSHARKENAPLHA